MSAFKAKVSELFSAAKSGDPIARLDRSVTADSLWPASVDKESDKAAIILRSFFVDGFVVPYRTLATCSQQIVKKCQGVVVFHILRDGLRSSIASGSGIMAMRLPNGQWSDGAAILVNHTSTLPPDVDGVDVVLIIRDKHIVAALSNPNANDWTPIESVPAPAPRASSAPDVSPTAAQTKAPVWSYAKSKGHLLVDFELQGLTIRDFTSENEKFYDVPGVTAQEILAGKVKAPSGGSDYLGKTLRAIDKEQDDYCGLPAAGKCPGDRRVKPTSMAGQ